MKRCISVLRHLAIALFVLSVLIVGVQSQAQAAFSLTLSDGTNTLIINDNQAGDVNPLSDAITYLGAIGNWSLNVSTGVSEGQIGISNMDLNSYNQSNSGGGTLTLTLTDTAFTLPSNYIFDIGGTIAQGGSLSASVTSTTGTTVNLGAFGGGAFSDTGTGSTSTPGEQTANIIISITHPETGNATVASSFDANLRPTPIPGAVWLLGSGLVGLVGIRRRSKKQDC